VKTAVREIDGVRFVSLPAVGAAMTGAAPADRLVRLLEACGARFHPSPYDRFVAEPVVALAGIGGLLFDWEREDPPDTVRLHGLTGPLSPDALGAALRAACGASALFTYLNPRDRPLPDLGATALRLGHRSVLHAAAANVLIAGHSNAVEHELASQRDLVHLSRLTVNRTTAQSDPPLRIVDAGLLPAAAEIMRLTRQHVSTVDDTTADALEYRHALFPAAKASAILLSGSVRNLVKLADAGVDKEAELAPLAAAVSVYVTSLCGLSDGHAP
jgi:hypothetical protein